MKQESFLKSFVTVGTATVINLAIGFFTTPIITRLVEPTEYGQASIFSMYTSLVLMFLCAGMDQSLIRFYYKCNQTSYKQRLFLEALIVSTLFTLVFITGGLMLVRFKVIEFEFDWFCTILLAVNILFNVIYRFCSLIVRLNHNNALYGRISVLQKIVYVVTSLFFIKIISMNGMYALSIAGVITVIICLLFSIYSQRAFLRCNSWMIRFENEEIKEMLKFGYPYIFSMGITSIFQSLDKLSLNYYRTYSEVGVYTSAMTFVSLFAVIQTSFNIIWAPRSVEHYEKFPDDKKYFNTIFHIMTVIMFSVGIVLILIKDIFALLLGPQYREAAYIMPFLIFHPIMYTISETTVGGINFAKKSSMHMVVSICVCAINFIGNTLLVPSFGCRGAAISTGISYIVFFIMRTLIAEKFYYVGFNMPRFLIMTTVTLTYAAYNTFFRFNIVSVFFAAFCYLILFLLYRESFIWGWYYIKDRVLSVLLKI